MRRLLPIGFVLIPLGAGAPAAGQERPTIVPSRDVVVEYRTLGRDRGQTIRISHAAGSGLTRIDVAQMGGFLLVDRAKRMSTVVMPDMRIYMEMGGGGSGGPAMPDDGAGFTRRGGDTVAGLACVVWDVSSADGTGTACITEDGTLLRYQKAGGDGIEATRVAYGAIPAADFTVPAGFQKMDVPAMGGMPTAPVGGGRPPR